VGPSGDVRLVPVCCALDAGRVVTAVDQKPKSTTSLARLGDIERTGRATVLADHYVDTEWSALWWVRITGPAMVLPAGDPAAAAAIDRLVAKYEQYRTNRPRGAVISIAVETVTSWRADDAS
jgi:PPOX class probable F420-dependent enzyme